MKMSFHSFFSASVSECGTVLFAFHAREGLLVHGVDQRVEGEIAGRRREWP